MYTVQPEISNEQDEFNLINIATLLGHIVPSQLISNLDNTTSARHS